MGFNQLVFASDNQKYVRPLNVGKAVKITLTDNTVIRGTLEKWDEVEASVVSNNERKIIYVNEIVKAVYLMGVVPEVLANLNPDAIKTVYATNKDVKNHEDYKKEIKKEIRKSNNEDIKKWKNDLNNAKALSVLGWVTGIAGLAAGVAIYADGYNQNHNPEWEQQGNYITNEKDVNEGNQKVIIGALVMCAGAGLITLGITQAGNANALKLEGEARGFELSIENKGDYTGLKLAYKY